MLKAPFIGSGARPVARCGSTTLPRCGDSETMKSLSMTPRLAGVCLTVAILLAAFPVFADHKASSRPRTTFVELGAVVVDDNDRAVSGLHRRDFRIKEDGRAVAVTSFSEVSASGIAAPAD